MTSADIIRALKRDGWSEARVKGSHHHFKAFDQAWDRHGPAPEDIPIGLLASIERQAGIKLR